MNRRVLGAVAAILIAAVGTFVLVAYVRGAEERALEGEQGVSVLVVSEPIAKGTPVSEIADRVTTELVPAKVQTAGTVEDLLALEGTVAAVDLLPGDQIVASRFITPSAFQAARPVEVPEGLLEVTVSSNPERAFGGQVSPGDTVAVVASFDPFQLDGLEPSFLAPGQDGAALTEVDTETSSEQVRSSPNTSHILLHKVLVTNVQVEQLPVAPEGQESIEGESPTYTPDLAPTGNLLISMAVTAPNIERLVFTAEFGTIWLAREPANAPEGNTYIQTRGSVYLPTEGLVPGGAMTKVVVATTDEDFAVRLGSTLADLNGDLRRIDYLPDEHAPPPRRTQVVFLGPGFETEKILETASWIDRARPGMRVIIVAEPDQNLLRAALRVGARDVLTADADGSELKRAYATALEAARPGSDGDPSERSRVITVASPKGGTGKTVIASNLAMGLASHHPQKVVLVDLDLLFGDVSNALMLIPEHTLADVARAKNLDGTTLKIYLTPHKGSLFALCAPETPVDAESVTPEQIPSVIELLASEFDYVVIDTAGGLDEATLFALEASTDIVLVTNMDVPSVRGARKFMDIARGLGLMHRRVHVVLNRADSRVGIELEDVSATIGAQVDVAIPSSRLVPVALNSGEPVIESNPRSPVGRKITELVDRFTEVPASNTSPSFFRRSGR